MDHSRARRSVHRRVLVRRTALLAATTLAVGFSLAPQVADAKPKAVPSAVVAPGDIVPVTGRSKAPSLSSTNPGVMANLFEWNWPSVANECTTVLGPAGYGGVQVAPPAGLGEAHSTSATGSDPSCTRGGRSTSRSSYKLTSRMGTEAQFKAMVHDLPQGRGEGLRRRGDQPHDRPGQHCPTAASRYTKYDYPALLPPVQLPQLPRATARSPRRRHRQPRLDRRLQQLPAGAQLRAGRALRTCGPRRPTCATSSRATSTS